MTDEEIHNIYLHMSGKAEGLVEATGKADFPVLFARAILEYEGMTKDMQNMASKSTYKEQLETKDEPVAWMYWQSCLNDDGTQTSPWVQRYSKFKPTESVINKDITPLYTTPQRTWVGLTDEEIQECLQGLPTQTIDVYARRIEAKLKDKNNG